MPSSNCRAGLCGSSLLLFGGAQRGLGINQLNLTDLGQPRESATEPPGGSEDHPKDDQISEVFGTLKYGDCLFRGQIVGEQRLPSAFPKGKAAL